MSKFFYSLILAFTILGLTLPSAVLAADLSFAPGHDQTTFTVDVLLNTDNQPINALQGSVEFPAQLLKYKDVSDANSVVTFWIKHPTITGNRIDFSGAIPGGFTGSRGVLFTLEFEKKSVTTAETGNLSFVNVQTFLNDGLGTQAQTNSPALAFSVKPGQVLEPLVAGDFNDIRANDHTQPQPFTIQVARSSNAFNNAWFLTFNTTDKESGMDYYQVQETKASTPKVDQWVTATSPYLLKDQNRSTYIFVRALDKAGNERLATLAPGQVERSSMWWILLLLVAVGLGFGLVWKLRSRHHTHA